MKSCANCGKALPLNGNPRRRTCSDACRKALTRRAPLAPVKDDEDWPSEFSATLSRLTLAQRAKLRKALEDDRLRAQAGVPQTVDLDLIDLPAHKLRAVLGPTADLTPYGWTPGAALLSFIDAAAQSLAGE